MKKAPQYAQNPEKDLYQGKTVDDLCPTETTKGKIKNCKCTDCKQYRKSLQTKKGKEATATDIREQSPWRKVRLAIVVVLAMAAGTSPEKSEAQKPPPRRDVQEQPITAYERNFEVQGAKIELDDSWLRYEPPEGKSISDLFKEEFARLVPFYKKWNIHLKGRTFRFVYDPSIVTLGKVQFLFEQYGKPSPDTKFFDEKNELMPVYFIAKNTTPDPAPIKIRYYRGSTIAHEIFHTLQGPHLGNDTLWQEGLAEAVEKLYERDYPETAHFSVRQTNPALEQEAQAMLRREAIFENNEVERIFGNLKWDDTWDLEEVKDENSVSELARYVARDAWLEWIQNHPDFLGRLIQRIELDNYWYTKPHEPNRKPNERFIFVGNSACQRYAAERLYPEEFRTWYDRQTIFDVPTAGERILLAYSYDTDNKCGIIAVKRVAKPSRTPSAERGNSTHMRTQLVPVPIFVLLKNGVEARFESKGACFEINIPRGRIERITDADGNEIPFVN